MIQASRSPEQRAFLILCIWFSGEGWRLGTAVTWVWAGPIVCGCCWVVPYTEQLAHLLLGRLSSWPLLLTPHLPPTGSSCSSGQYWWPWPRPPWVACSGGHSLWRGSHLDPGFPPEGALQPQAHACVDRSREGLEILLTVMMKQKAERKTIPIHAVFLPELLLACSGVCPPSPQLCTRVALSPALLPTHSPSSSCLLFLLSSSRTFSCLRSLSGFPVPAPDTVGLGPGSPGARSLSWKEPH